MKKIYKILIFTDLDATLLHRDTFKFDEIKDYLKQLISKGIFIIPNTSKTEKEILEFNNELGSSLPYICENGAAIKGLELLNSNLPKELILSKEKNNIIKIFIISSFSLLRINSLGKSLFNKSKPCIAAPFSQI